MPVPDFGEKIVDHEDAIYGTIKLSCKYMAPGLTMHDIMMAYYEAEKGCSPGDQFAGNPAKWPGARGVSAVLDLVLKAVYKDDRMANES